MAVMRETRRVAKLLRWGRKVVGDSGYSAAGWVCCLPSCCSGVKALGSADDEESAASWVIRMKSLAEEKKKAEKKVCHSPPPLYNALEYALFVIIVKPVVQHMFVLCNLKFLWILYKSTKMFLYEIRSLHEHNRCKT